MNELQTSVPATLASPRSSATNGRHAPAALHLCLVVSVSPRRAQWLVRAAHDEHWSTIVCNKAEDALRQSTRQRVDLALVDLQSALAAEEPVLRLLVEQLAARNGPLVAVCGKPDDTIDEVWTRQLGVWMYLPGVDSQSDIALLCAEARNILQKLSSAPAKVAR